MNPLLSNILNKQMPAFSQVHQLKQIISIFEDNLFHINSRSAAQRQLFNQYITIFDKFSKSIINLSSKITEHSSKLQKRSCESTICIFKCLANLLNKIGNSAKGVAVKGKNQIYDPLKLFNDNYANLNKSFLTNLKAKEQQLTEKFTELFKNRQNYIGASERQEKNKKVQGKLMLKIENGDLSELQKFNSNIKKITEGIKITEQQYAASVMSVNKAMQDLRVELKNITDSLNYNEQSRISFTKKSLLSSVKNLKDIMPEYGVEVQTKLETELQEIQKINNQSFLNSALNFKIQALTSSQEKEEFVSYDDLLKKKRRKLLQEQNAHLTEIFSKVKNQDKGLIRKFVRSWFQSNNNNKNMMKQIEGPPMSPEWDVCKKMLPQVHPYSFFFIETIFEEITEMSSIYCKLNDDNFSLVLDLFTKIIQSLKITEPGSTTLISVQFLYRMIHISMRIMWKKNSAVSRSQPIQLLCQYLGKKCTALQSENVFEKIFNYLQKKKINKKAPVALQSPRGMMSSFMKGMQEAMNIKKEAKLNEEEQFSCTIEVTYMMANLLIPNQVSIPVIKKLLGKGENSRSFDYLKSILFEKKDQQERQKIFFRTQIKQKMQIKMKKVIENKKLAQCCIKITAKRGFLGKQDINLRLVCRQLQDIHKNILYGITMAPQDKWIHLIPYLKMNYQKIKKQVQEKKLAPSVQQIIVLDVNRSLHNHTDVLSQQLLKHLLRAYACYHPELGYCQGMNYIAGYLYIKSKDEQKAYRMFHYLMENRFKELFANQFEVLKIKLYQFERLLGIFHPEISEHFKRQGITPQCYIVAWIITIFASSYQYTQESYFIDLLWERFIIWGWREFFRFVLAMFNIFKDQIIQLTYDKAMHFLGFISRSDFIKANKEEYFKQYGNNHLEKLVEQYQISQDLLQSLAKQYELK